MIIDNIDSNSNLTLHYTSINGAYINLDVTAKMECEETDTDIIYITSTCIFHRDLRYLKECCEGIVNNNHLPFGFTSADKILNYWVSSEDFKHHFLLHDPRQNCPYESQCNLFLSPSVDMMRNSLAQIDKVLNGIQVCGDQVERQNQPFSIIFPCIEEYVDPELFVLRISVDSPFYHISRKFDSSQKGIELLKKNIIDLKNNKILKFSIVADYMEIHFVKCDNIVDIKGEISDFTWPEPNEIKFHEQADIALLDQMYYSLDSL